MILNCPECGKTLHVRDELAGKKGKCPGCGAVLRVPELPSGVQETMPRTGSHPADKGLPSSRPGMGLILVCVLSPLSFAASFMAAGIADWIGVSEAVYMALPLSLLVASFLFLFLIGFFLARRLQRSGTKWALLGLVTVGITNGGLALWWLHQPESGATRKLRISAWVAMAVSIGVIALIGHGLEESQGRPLDISQIPGVTVSVQRKKCGNCGREVSVLSKVGDHCPDCGVLWTREKRK